MTKLLRLWHGSAAEVERFDPAATRDRGCHFGSREQAAMRNAAVLHHVELVVSRVRRCRDRGDFASAVRSARAAGFDAIVYLNRYEGMSVERIEALSAAGRLSGLDDLSDAQFRRLVPEACDSYIALDQTRIRVLEIIHCEKQKDRKMKPAAHPHSTQTDRTIAGATDRFAETPVDAQLDRLFADLDERSAPARAPEPEYDFSL